MAGGQETRVVPGPVKNGACPPPREIVVIETRKVFDFCFQEDVLERCFFVAGLGPGAMVTGCEITDVTCNEILDREPIPGHEGFFLVSLQVTLELSITIVPEAGAARVTVTRTIAFPKRVALCAPEGTDVTCDVQGTCICTLQPNQEVGQEPNICCTIQLVVVVTSTANVKLLVPSFGVVVPQECRDTAPAVQPGVPPEQCIPTSELTTGD